MKSLKTKQLYKWLLILVVGIGMVTTGTSVIAQADPDDCSLYTSQNSGNLLGYIVASGLPSQDQQNYIWLNSEDDPWEGAASYGVTYDRSTGVLSGRGWNEGLRVWVDFDEGSSDEALVLDADEHPVGGYQWGYWNGEIKGLDNLVYSNNQASFIPQGTQSADIDNDGNTDFTYTWPYDAQYVSGSSSDDVIIGLGELNFENVVFSTSSIPSQCQEYVDVLANGLSSLHLSSCGQTVELTWNTQNIEPGTCSTVSNGAPWLSPGSRNDTEFDGEDSGAVNSSVNFALRCTGAISGNQVTGIAQVTCGSSGGGGGAGPVSGNNFEYIES